jgi:hypothetical protein
MLDAAAPHFQQLAHRQVDQSEARLEQRVIRRREAREYSVAKFFAAAVQGMSFFFWAGESHHAAGNSGERR